MKKKEAWLLSLTLIAMAFSMRAPMSCVGPLTSQLRADLHLSSAVAGFLTTIPLMVFALTAPLAGRVAIAADTRTLMLSCLGADIAGLLLRSFGGIVGLFLGTVLLGLAIGTLNVLTPAWVRKQFPTQIGLMMGIYSTAMTASSAIAAGVCQPLTTALGSWRLSLASPALLAALAILVLLPTRKLIVPRLPAVQSGGDGFRLKGRHVAIAIFMGIQSFLFFSLLAWYPSIVGALCPGITITGMLVLLLQVASLVPAFLIPIVSSRIGGKGALACGVTLVFSLGFAVVLLANGSLWLVLLGTVLLGLGCGATMSLALTLVAMQGKTAAETAKVSAFAQCVGYLIASLGPTAFGFLYDRLASWTPILCIQLGLSLLMAATGLLAGKPEKGNA